LRAKKAPGFLGGKPGARDSEELDYVNHTENHVDSQTFRIADTKSEGQSCLSENAPLKNASATLVHKKKSQAAAVLRLLIDAHGSWVPLPAILALGIAQYGARILELRRLGFVIENKTERVAGARHSWFRLLNSPSQSGSAR
jgi:hypothetical protein